MDAPLKAVWFATRKYPPRTGGMEKLAQQIASALAANGPAVILPWRHSQIGLPLFVAWAALRILYGRARGRVSVLYVGDPVLCILAALVRHARIPVVITVHGLDVLFPSVMYQRYLRTFFWHRFDRYVCISNYVAGLLTKHGISPERLVVVAPGIALDTSYDASQAH